ncbi:rod-binding protein [Methylobacterium sp. HMF5984]|jgi:Rod binding domain-containing protein|uniref:rod-binding protein n=1 Tax=unclassified Methylobacterium TaxID=2615210 RepID=UPI001FB8818D|nr:rod-binding protein [Methylobacterium sp. J-092]MCJ2006672.1 rod-binding protein [Methylobacterium sp. J-092]
MLPLATFAVSAAIGVGKAITGAVADTTSKTAQASTEAATKKARKTANDFESMFLESSLDRLTQSEGTDGPLGENGTGGGVYRSMLTKEYAGQIMKSGGVGIANQVFSEMMKMQGGAAAGAGAAHAA